MEPADDPKAVVRANQAWSSTTTTPGMAASIAAFAGRQGDHRHELERTPLLRAEGGQGPRFQYEEQRHANFLAPEIAKAAVEGRLPRGFGLKRLVDLPMAWPDQWRALGLQAPAQA